MTEFQIATLRHYVNVLRHRSACDQEADIAMAILDEVEREEGVLRKRIRLETFHSAATIIRGMGNKPSINREFAAQALERAAREIARQQCPNVVVSRTIEPIRAGSKMYELYELKAQLAEIKRRLEELE